MPFDVEGARNAGYSLDEIGRHVGFDVDAARKAGYDDNAISGYLAKSDRPKPAAESPVPEDYVPEWGKKHPALYGVAGAAYETLKPVAEVAGLTGGATLGAVSPIPGGSVIGAGLGYGAAKRLEQTVGEALGVKQPEVLPEALKQTVKDIISGSAIEAGGQVAGAILPKALEVISPKTEARMYERVMKPSTTLKEAEKAKRIDTALNEGIPLTKAGVEKSKNLISGINKEVQDRIAQFSKSGATADLENVIREAEAMRQAKITGKLLTPETAQGQVSDVVNEALRNAPEKIPLQQAQIFKQSINKELDDFYKAVHTSPDKTTFLSQHWTAKTKAALANGLRDEISNIFPEVKALNKREGALIQLNKSLERAVNRISNREIWSLKNIAAMIKSPKWAFTEYILNNPTVQSSLAVAIRQARIKGLGNIPKAIEATTKGTALIGNESDKNYVQGGEIIAPVQTQNVGDVLLTDKTQPQGVPEWGRKNPTLYGLAGAINSLVGGSASSSIIGMAPEDVSAAVAKLSTDELIELDKMLNQYGTNISAKDLVRKLFGTSVTPKGYAEGGEIKPNRLRPAIRLKGKTLIGDTGDNHDTILEKHGMSTATGRGDKSRGFVNSKGHFLSRKEAVHWLKTNDPNTFNKLENIYEDMKGNGLYTEQYNKALGMPERKAKTTKTKKTSSRRKVPDDMKDIK